MTCQNLQNKLLNITVLFTWYLLQIVGEFKKNVTRQTWQALFHFGEYLFQPTRHFDECLKNMVSHTEIVSFYVSTAIFFLLHCDEWDRVVALPRHKFVTGATLLQLDKACSI